MRTDFARELCQFGALVDPKTGIIRSVDLIRLSPLDPPVFLAYAEPCDTTPLVGMQAANRGAACSPSPERAIVRACGESIERYCSAFFDITALHLASEEELSRRGDRFVAVHDLYPFAAWQYDEPDFPYQRTDGRRVRWVPGTALRSGEEVWLPASCVYVPYLFDHAVEPFTHMPISTGLAAGPDAAACIRKGILEIVERDALMLVWYHRLVTPRIDPPSCQGFSPLVDQLLSAAQPGGPCWYLNVLTLDIDVPVVSAALIDPGDPPLTSFGIAADPDPVRALLLALEEASLTRLLVNRSEETVSPRNYASEGVRTLRDHLFAHATSRSLRDALRFMTDDGPTVKFEQLVQREHDSTTLDQHLAAAGREAIWVDVTTDDVADFGFRVVRTAVPGMQPLDDDHRCRYLGGQRLVGLPAALGLPEVTLDQLNPDPHPFP